MLVSLLDTDIVHVVNTYFKAIHPYFFFLLSTDEHIPRITSNTAMCFQWLFLCTLFFPIHFHWSVFFLFFFSLSMERIVFLAATFQMSIHIKFKTINAMDKFLERNISFSLCWIRLLALECEICWASLWLECCCANYSW